MFHVIRDANGAIQALSRQPQQGGEMLDESDPEVQQFVHPEASESATELVDDGFIRGVDGCRSGCQLGLNAADVSFVRVLEDLVDILIDKNMIRHTDLPMAAQQKLLLRKGLRSRMQDSLDLLGGEERLF